MSQARLFMDQDVSSRRDVLEAFKTGQFSHDVINYLKEHNVATIVASIPHCTDQITLSPAILELNEGKLCGIFNALPAHVKNVNLQFENLQDNQLARFKGLMAHSGYSKSTDVFNLQWDFHRYPMCHLMKDVMSRAIPRQLTEFNFVHGAGIERVTHQELMTFKAAKLAPETHAHLKTHYHLRSSNH